MKYLALLLATTILAGGSIAEAAERQSKLTEPDVGIRVVDCSPTKRVNVVGLVGQPITITFHEGDSVYRIELAYNFSVPGDPQASWHIPTAAELKDHPLGNNMTIWPIKPSTEMMSVITARDPDGRGQIVHPFRVVGRPAPDSSRVAAAPAPTTISDGAGTPAVDQPDITYNIICKYASAVPNASSEAAHRERSNDDRASDVTERKPSRKERRQQEQAAAAQRLLVDAFNGTSGCHYAAQPPESPLKPKCPLDNGQWTMMRFPGLSAKPTIYTGTCDGKEQLARQHGHRDFVVVETIASSFCLRHGSYAINIINYAYNPAGAPTGNGTIAPNHQRDVIQARSTK